MLIDLSGLWRCEIPGIRAELRLPGTLDEGGIGFPDDPARQWKVDEVRRIGLWREGDPIVTRLTRKHTFEGRAVFSREVHWAPPAGERVFAEVERARQLRLFVNGREAPAAEPACLSAPQVFEVTGLVTGQDAFAFWSDNSYPGWPRQAIIASSAASDETQTNWNGLLGRLRLRTERPVFCARLRVYPAEETLDVCAEIDAACAWQGALRIRSDALREDVTAEKTLPPGRHELWFRQLPLRPGVRRWDEEEGQLYSLTVEGPGLETKKAVFGIRVFRAEDGHLTLNGRRIFLRGETNCAVFPETGHPPMDTAAWRDILLRYRAYGVNCVRFHSHCPPDAAFAAADALGMLMQPELSCWDPLNAFAAAEAQAYYRAELGQVLRMLANHPSFVMLTFGNELQAAGEGRAFMNSLLAEARAFDPTRLYAAASNPHYGEQGADPQSDFYTAMRLRDADMRATFDGMTGWLNQAEPNSCRDYSAAVAALRRESAQPVFSFEVGQYEVLPDFGEIDLHQGVTSPENLRHSRQRVQALGLAEDWPRMREATGENSLRCYRAEVEAALRTEGYSGIFLLGLQDFPGQGTALTGMMNAHLQPKPGRFARPERFAAFFRPVLPLALLERFTYAAGETLRAVLKIANYGKTPLDDAARWRLRGPGFVREGRLPAAHAPAGSLTALGELAAPLPDTAEALQLTLEVTYGGSRNEWPLWVYPPVQPVCPAGVEEVRAFDGEARAALRSGGTVYLAPDSTAAALPCSVQAQFSPDFWSVCTFPHQSGAMGQLIDAEHPIFRHFPTEPSGGWQWWPMAGQRALILPERIDTIIAEMDSFALLRPMAQLFECRCGPGRLLVSSLGLHRLQQFPEARALQHAIYRYLDSPSFAPAQQLSEAWIAALFDSSRTAGA